MTPLLVATHGHIPCRTPGKIAAFGFLGTCGPAIEYNTPNNRVIFTRYNNREDLANRDGLLMIENNPRSSLANVSDRANASSVSDRECISLTNDDITVNDNDRDIIATRRNMIN